jgi:hypothetical protein
MGEFDMPNLPRCLVFKQTEQRVRTALWECAQGGLVSL